VKAKGRLNRPRDRKGSPSGANWGESKKGWSEHSLEGIGSGSPDSRLVSISISDNTIFSAALEILRQYWYNLFFDIG
jgi:hypothetical protein